MTSALIIAVGKTNHHNPFTPEKQIGTITAIERIALLLQTSGIQRIVVICDEDELPKKLVPSMNLIFLTPSAGGEMLDSVKAGLRYLTDKCSEVIVAHVNVPMFSRSTISELLASEQNICIPSFQGHRGHPILLRKPCFQAIINYTGENGLRGALEASGFPKEIISVKDPGILSDREDGISYEALAASHDISKLRPSFQIRISRERAFYGPGPHQLLTLTEELGSLSNACQYMGISYSKGRKIIRTMEEQLGVPVLETHQGGKDGGFSHLTEDARHLSSSYDAFCKEAEEVLQTLFRKYFPSDDTKAVKSGRREI